MHKDISELLISEIAIGERFRKDVGDVSDLAQSIATVGQLQPVVITADNKLIAGLRRIRACEKIGLQSVLVAVAHDVETARQLLIAERDENTCRKSFTPSEAVALGQRLEDLETPAAKKRREAGKKIEQPSSDSDEGLTVGRTDDIVAESVGMGRDKYRKAKEVVEEASKPNATPEVIQAALTMDRTGKVDPAHKVVRAANPRESVSRTPADICSVYVDRAIKLLEQCPHDAPSRRDQLERVAEWLTENGL